MADQGRTNTEKMRWSRLIPVVVIAVLLTVLNPADVPIDWIQKVGEKIVRLTRIRWLASSLLQLINIILFWLGVVFSFWFLYALIGWLSSSFSEKIRTGIIRLFRAMIWMLLFMLLYSFAKHAPASWLMNNLSEYSGLGLLGGENRTLMRLLLLGVLISFAVGIVALVQIYGKAVTKSGLKLVRARKSDDKLKRATDNVKPVNFDDMSFVRIMRLTGSSAHPDEMLRWDKNDRIEIRDGTQVIQLLRENGEAFILGTERISLPINTPYALYEQTTGGKEIQRMTITYIK